MKSETDLIEARLVTKDGIDITDKLPFETIDFRGDPMVVVNFEAPHKSSSTGRIYTDDGSSYFPSVADLEIVDHDFSEQRANFGLGAIESPSAKYSLFYKDQKPTPLGREQSAQLDQEIYDKYGKPGSTVSADDGKEIMAMYAQAGLDDVDAPIVNAGDGSFVIESSMEKEIKSLKEELAKNVHEEARNKFVKFSNWLEGKHDCNKEHPGMSHDDWWKLRLKSGTLKSGKKKK